MNKVAPARAAAFAILLAIERGSGHSDELLHHDTVTKLAAADRNLTTNLVMGTLRWQIAIDARVDALLTRPGTQLDPNVRMALRLGAFQLLYLDRIPVYAAIGESVELAKHGGNRYAAGMVNAVLRKVAAQPRKQVSDTVTNSAGLAAAYAHPQWLVDRWIKRYGAEAARGICEYDQQPGPVHVRLSAPGDEDELLRDGIELAPASFLANTRRVTAGDITATGLFRTRRVRLQDEGSQLVAELAGAGQRILDACAAPGGKTAILAERNPEAAITACDVSARRLAQMKKHADARIEFMAGDVAEMRFSTAFDLALCDAPCSGTGTLGRNPEIRHRLKAEELERQQGRQKRIVLAVMNAVKPGGRLLYSTCSLEPEENEAVVEQCLSEREDFELVRMDAEIDRLEREGTLLPAGAERLRATALANGCLRTVPGIHDCDGFFAAVLLRRP